MRLFTWFNFLLFVSFAIAWSVEDQEILQVNYELQQDYPGKSFYDFLNLPNGPKSTLKEISKQYRKLSVKYHPDKVSRKKGGKKALKLAQRNFERLSLINNILKGPTKDRYDFFLKTGFPKYKNNRFLYDRFKPSFIFTAVFLYLIVGVGHFVILKISATQDRKRIQGIIDQIKGYAIQQSAGGVITEQRKYKLEQFEKPFLVRIDGVFVIEDEDTMTLSRVTTDVVKDPRIVDSYLVKIPVGMWNQTIGRVVPSLKYEIKPQEDNAKTEENNFEEQGKKKKKQPKGEKLVLPNGKVVYGKKSR